jgi:hypothetical protein
MNSNFMGLADIHKKRLSLQSTVDFKQDISSRRNSKYMSLDCYFDKCNDKKISNQEINNEYVPFKGKDLHIHCHSDIKLPHIHSSCCDRVVSAHDANRDKRYYFTNELTPVRVYINYNNKEPGEDDKHAFVPFNTTNQNTKLRVSEKFLKEITSMKFVKETLSFIPSNPMAKNTL